MSRKRQEIYSVNDLFLVAKKWWLLIVSFAIAGAFLGSFYAPTKKSSYSIRKMIAYNYEGSIKLRQFNIKKMNIQFIFSDFDNSLFFAKELISFLEKNKVPTSQVNSFVLSVTGKRVTPQASAAELIARYAGTTLVRNSLSGTTIKNNGSYFSMKTMPDGLFLSLSLPQRGHLELIFKALISSYNKVIEEYNQRLHALKVSRLRGLSERLERQIAVKVRQLDHETLKILKDTPELIGGGAEASSEPSMSILGRILARSQEKHEGLESETRFLEKTYIDLSELAAYSRIYNDSLEKYLSLVSDETASLPQLMQSEAYLSNVVLPPNSISSLSISKNYIIVAGFLAGIVLSFLIITIVETWAR